MHRVLFICLCVFVEAMEFLRAGPMQTLVIPIPSMGAGTSKSSRWPFLGKTMSNDLTVSLNFSTDWFQIGKGVRQGCILSPAYLTFMQSNHEKHWGWKKHKLESRFSSVAVMSDSLQPHESQHARPPCPSPTPGVHSDSLPSSQ